MILSYVVGSLFAFIGYLDIIAAQNKTADSESAVVCVKQQWPHLCRPKARRYDVMDMGDERLFHGWADVQGIGAANDYCRIINRDNIRYLSCALAGTHGQSDMNYNSATHNFEVGHTDTWYMKDEDNDGRDDYCRCIGNDRRGYEIMCTKAGPLGFYGSTQQGGTSNTFAIANQLPCSKRKVRPEFGRAYAVPQYPTVPDM